MLREKLFSQTALFLIIEVTRARPKPRKKFNCHHSSAGGPLGRGSVHRVTFKKFLAAYSCPKEIPVTVLLILLACNRKSE